MTRRTIRAALAAWLAAAALPAGAHHSFRAQYDPAQLLTLTGVVGVTYVTSLSKPTAAADEVVPEA